MVMNNNISSDIVDFDDFCRACRGEKGHNSREVSDRTGRMVDVWNPCFHCDGTGKRTVRVIKQEQSETDGVVSIPLFGKIGPGHNPILPHPPPSDGDPAQTPSLTARRDGAQGATKLDETGEPPARVPPWVARMLALGKVNMHPEARDEQLQWAREQLHSDKQLGAYRELMACKAVLALSREAAEIEAVKRIKIDVDARYKMQDEPLEFDVRHLALAGIAFLIITMLIGALWGVL
jgi:hypothetical protein